MYSPVCAGEGQQVLARDLSQGGRAVPTNGEIPGRDQVAKVHGRNGLPGDAIAARILRHGRGVVETPNLMGARAGDAVVGDYPWAMVIPVRASPQ